MIQLQRPKYLHSLGNKLNDPQTCAKSYWSILNKLLQKIRIPLIPPILSNGTFITNVYEKITLFNTFFADQCTPINNSSTLPPFEYKVNSKIEDVSFSEHEIVSIIQSLNSNKAHGWDGISIRMIKICDETIALPLKIIFDTALKSGSYPDKWKRANVVPVHKKESKNMLKNYRPISLLPVCGKIFKKCIYNSLYSYLESNDILSKSQSGFRKGDSCISQLLAITHEIYSNFDAYPSLETRGVFLDISKAFDRVWHEGLLYKLKSYGISGPLLILIKSFLTNRFQRVVLNGQTSNWKNIESVQYNAALAITGAIHGSSRDKLYQELGFESLHDRRWFRKLCFYYKIRNNMCPLYLTELLPIMKISCYSLRLNRAPTVPNFRTERFKSTFFPSCYSIWNQLDPNIQNSSSIVVFKRALLSFIRPKPANVYRIHHPRGRKLLTRLRLGLSHLREHKFRHNFNDTIDPFCLCGTNNLETSEHFLLHCPTYACLRRKLFDNLHNNNILLLPLEKSIIVQILLHGSDNYNTSMNKIIISTVIDFIIQSKRFDDPLIK